MVVKRVSDLNITRRSFITAIEGNINDSFVDEDLCSYTFEQQLYLYLKNEGYERVYFYTRASGYNWYSFDKESLASLFPKKTNNSTEDGRPLGSRRLKKPINSDDNSNHIKEGKINRRPYYYVSNFEDSTLIKTVQDILKDIQHKSAIYFTSPVFSLNESQGFIAGIAQIMSEVAAIQSENKLLIKLNSNGVFKADFFTEHLKSSDNIFSVGFPDIKECENWLNSERIKGLIDSEVVFSFPFEKLVKGVCQKRMRISELNKEIKTNKAGFIQSTNKSDEDVLSELNKMIGLRGVKETLQGIIADVKAKQLRAEYGQTDESKVKLNFVFKGNPGTGKTTVAGLLGKILANYGLISDPEVVVYTKGQLLDGLVGGGSRLVEKMFSDSIGKVLFIDEAYQLAEDDAKDALDALTNMLTDKRFEDNLAVVLAGYPGDMAKLINSNSGLKRRFTQNILFEDYTNDELTEIFCRMVEFDHLVIGEEAILHARAYFTSLKRNKGFGNAGEAENLLRNIIKPNQARRLQRINNPTKEDVFTILPQDFPNYGKIKLKRNNPKQELDISPIDKLNKLVGIDNIRKKFEEYVAMTHFCQENPQAEISTTFRPHMAFLGNPGTGKTTVAKLFAEILRQEGVLSNNNFVKVGPSDLVGEWLGQSGPKARGQFERARGGVLFIDEAYQLCSKNQLNGGDQYGKEVITELLTFMEDERDTIVILAGYTEEIRYLIAKGNPGLSSRVTNEFIFEDYEPELLYTILLNNLSEYELSEDFKIKIRQIINIEYENRDKTQWGNARTIEKYASDIFLNYLVKHNAKGVIDIDCIPDYLLRDSSQFTVDIPEEVTNISDASQQSIVQNPKVLPFDKDKLLESLKSVKGQQDNVEIIAEEINTWIKDAVKEAPLVFMLAGTSGTGKTFTAETINAALKDYRMVKLNMNEYSSDADSWKLLGSSSGYMGSDEDSPIFAARRETPNLLILFDEIEKAHPSLFTTIMTLMEKGEMGNGHGEVFDFKQSIIVFTTNLAMKELLKLKKESVQNNIDPSSPKFQDAARDILKAAGLKDEISGRVTWVLVYNTLDAPMVAQIAMERIRKLGSKYGIKINAVHKTYLEEIAKQCADNNEGARPVNRMITRKLKPIFQKVCETNDCDPNVLYDVDEHFQIIPSSSSVIIPVESLNFNLGVDASESKTDSGPVEIKLSSGSFFESGYNYESYRKAIGLIELDNGNSGTGSGFLISNDGYILTCAHCTEAKKIVFVKDDDKEKYEAHVVYKNELIDIAVLKIDVSNMPYLSISDSVKPLKIGTEIVILGYPSGTDVSENVSAFEGKISNYIGGIKSYITDAIAAPGSSGGALIAKKDGKVYGVLRGGYKETLGVDINASSDIRDLFKQNDIVIEYN